jgi:hypothetical protein
MERLLQLPPNYTARDVELKEAEMRTRMQSGSDRRKVGEMIQIYQQAKERILEQRFPLSSKTQFPVGRLDARYDVSSYPMLQDPPKNRRSEIVEHPPSQYVYNDSSEYYTGILNPINTRLIKKVITMDTKFRENYYKTSSSNFLMVLPERINKVAALQLSSVEFPSWKLSTFRQSYGNTYMYIKILLNTNNLVSGSLVIPDLTYTTETSLVAALNAVTTFKDHIAWSLTTSNYIKLTITGATVTKVFLDFTGMSVIPVTTTSNVTILETKLQNGVTDVIEDYTEYEKQNTKKCYDDLNKNGVKPITKTSQVLRKNTACRVDSKDTRNFLANNGLAWSLGFRKSNYLIEKTISTSITAESPVTINPMTYFYLGLDEFHSNGDNTFLSCIQNAAFNSKILARIPLPLNAAQSQQGFITNNIQVPWEQRKYFGPIDIHKIQIQMYDDFGRPLDMQGMDYSITLTATMLYDA